MRRIPAFAAFVLSGAMASATVAAPAPAPRAELPIREVDLSDGARRYVVTIGIAGRDVEAGLDTGSAGLRLLPEALPAELARGGGAEVKAAYGSGSVFVGREIRATLTIGAAQGSVPVERVDSIRCADQAPHCAVAGVAHPRIMADGLAGEGFAAILGIDPRDNLIPNPLTLLGIRRWIVELPRPGEGRAGRLILNPTEDETAAYRRFKMVEGMGGVLPGCLGGADERDRICGAVRFDTGAPGLKIAAAAPPAGWPNGSEGRLSVGDGGGALTMRFTYGRRDQASRLTIARDERGGTRIIAGIAPYFTWSVLYDSDARTMGLKPR
jgi:hypothetical protein